MFPQKRDNTKCTAELEEVKHRFGPPWYVSQQLPLQRLRKRPRTHAKCCWQKIVCSCRTSRQFNEYTCVLSGSWHKIIGKVVRIVMESTRTARAASRGQEDVGFSKLFFFLTPTLRMRDCRLVPLTAAPPAGRQPAFRRRRWRRRSVPSAPATWLRGLSAPPATPPYEMPDLNVNSPIKPLRLLRTVVFPVPGLPTSKKLVGSASASIWGAETSKRPSLTCLTDTTGAHVMNSTAKQHTCMDGTCTLRNRCGSGQTHPSANSRPGALRRAHRAACRRQTPV